MSSILGLPADLVKVLGALPCENLIPTWSLKQDKGTFSLRIFWNPKPAVKTPAISHVSTGRHLSKPKSSNSKSNESVDVQAVGTDRNQPTVSHTPALHSEKPSRRKRKSPSARKRDYNRLLAWRAKKSASKTGTSKSMDTPDAGSVVLSSKHPKSEPPSSSCDPVEPTVHRASPEAQSQDKVGADCLDTSVCDSDDTEHQSSEADDSFDSKCDPNGYCITCLIPAAKVAGGLKKCTRCWMVRYCGRECQIKDWKNHSRLCSELADLHLGTASR